MKWGQPKGPSMSEQIVKIHTRDYYSTGQRNEAQTRYNVDEPQGRHAKGMKPDT